MLMDIAPRPTLIGCTGQLSPRPLPRYHSLQGLGSNSAVDSVHRKVTTLRSTRQMEHRLYMYLWANLQYDSIQQETRK